MVTKQTGVVEVIRTLATV